MHKPQLPHLPRMPHLPRVHLPHIGVPDYVPHVEPVFAKPVTASGKPWHSVDVKVSTRSRVGLFAANFLLAELVGVLIPLLNDYLLGRGWRYDAIGLATALAGLGLFIAQIPVGLFLDRVRAYRATLMIAAVTVGLSFGALPFLTQNPVALDLVLFVSGIGEAFMMPLLSTLALALAGHAGVNKLMGYSQSWNHAGNIFASLAVMWLVTKYGMEAAFYTTTLISVLAASSCLIIRGDEIHGQKSQPQGISLVNLLKDTRLQRLLIASLLFHVANAPITPVVAMYARDLGAEGGFVTKLVFAAQLVMVGAAYTSAYMGDKYGRKPIMTVAFMLLPLRICMYAWFTDPDYFLPVAILDGAAVGIYTVIVASICADIDNGRGCFNTLVGLVFSTLALGNVVSPLVGGLILQHWGFATLFYMFDFVALVGAVFFVLAMPETNSQTDEA